MPEQLKLNTITVSKVIVHSIPKHQKGDLTIEPKYSKLESKLSDGLKLFFRDKIIQALASDKSFRISFNDNSDSPVSYLIKEVLGNNDLFIDKSKSLAKHLFETQIGSNAAGILVVILAKVNTYTTCLLLKLEMDKGMQLTLDPKTDSYDIAEVEDLMLTQKTKIYKVALLIRREDFDAKYDGLIMDYQIDMKSKREVTTWFIDKFLGCNAYEDPKITTQKFYNLTKTYIDTIEEPILRAKYLQDLNSYVQCNKSTLSPREFADDYLSNKEDKTNYKSFLESKNFGFSSFIKDLTQISRQVQKITVLFANDISIIGNKGTFDDNVKFEKMNDGKTKAEIISKIKIIK
ncbi:nucleoid-associated protein [Pedobacter alpinus]|uniref:Nucleoid-associated protein n=1 Tax=Pedobacter alpinus TaxID=1590643 RepID=A0ABW5TNY2_9SPHI